MTVIKQLNEHNGIVKAIVEVNGVMIPVELNKGFKSHLERNQEVVRKAERYCNAMRIMHEVAVQGESPVDKVLNMAGAEVLLGQWEADNGNISQE